MKLGDILTDADLLAEDFEAGTAFGDSPLRAKREVAGRWASVRMERTGLLPRLHSVRVEPTAWASAGGISSWSNVSAALSTKTENDLQLSTYINTVTDFLLVGSPKPFRGLYVSMLDGVNANSLSLGEFTYWDGGNWQTPASLVDSTLSNSISFSGGGRVMWQAPDDWEARPYAAGGSHPWLYYMRVKLGQVPSAAARVGQLLPIRPSRLTRPMAMYALGVTYQEGVGGQRGSWAEKAEWYLKSANDELESVLGSDGIRDEFDIDESQAVGGGEAASVNPPNHEWLRG